MKCDAELSAKEQPKKNKKCSKKFLMMLHQKVSIQ